jgi:hypothetical protein
MGCGASHESGEAGTIDGAKGGASPTPAAAPAAATATVTAKDESAAGAGLASAQPDGSRGTAAVKTTTAATDGGADESGQGAKTANNNTTSTAPAAAPPTASEQAAAAAQAQVPAAATAADAKPVAATSRLAHMRGDAGAPLDKVYDGLVSKTAALLGALQTLSSGLVAREKTTTEAVVANVVGKIPLVGGLLSAAAELLLALLLALVASSVVGDVCSDLDPCGASNLIMRTPVSGARCAGLWTPADCCNEVCSAAVCTGVNFVVRASEDGVDCGEETCTHDSAACCVQVQTYCSSFTSCAGPSYRNRSDDATTQCTNGICTLAQCCVKFCVSGFSASSPMHMTPRRCHAHAHTRACIRKHRARPPPRSRATHTRR